MFKERRSNLGDRRKQDKKIGVPFKDSNGVTVRGERRHTPDRRVNDNEAEVRSGELSRTG